MLELLLLRHGEAAFALPDCDRNLTERGITQTQQVLQQSADALAGLTGCYVSPYRRAQQTAQLVSQQVGMALDFTVLDGLQPDSSVDGVIDWLQPQQGLVLLVAHNPLLTRLLNRLLDASSVGQSQRYQFDTSTLASLSMPVVAAGMAELNWIRFPE